jgi:hypothetical protein
LQPWREIIDCLVAKGPALARGFFSFYMNSYWTQFRKKLWSKHYGSLPVPTIWGGFLLALILTTVAASAQVCDAPEIHPQVDSAFDDVRAEIKGLGWLRRGQEISKSIPAPAPPDDPERSKQAELRNTLVITLNNNYDCAARFVAPYKDSKIVTVRDSVESILTGIETSKQVNREALKELAAVDKAHNASEVDPSITERLDKLTKSENEARAMISLGVKISTLGLVRTKDDKPAGEPVAFTITGRQREILTEEVAQFVKEKSRDPSFVDDCANMLLSLLNKKLPTANS